ncbi:MAG: type II secretion system protein [Patescibacteria group bacterium]|nr:type II secretion system GspH family protein [Patescibacteria group bacterium]
MKLLSKSEKGFTLIEIVIYIGIVAAVLSTVILFLVNIIEGISKSVAIQEVQHNIRFSMAKIKLDVQEADSLDFASSVLDNDDGKLVIEGGSNTITYEIQNGVLVRLIDAGPVVEVTSSKVIVTQLRVENRSFADESENIEVYITIIHKNPAKQKEFEVTRTIKTSLSVRAT